MPITEFRISLFVQICIALCVMLLTCQGLAAEDLEGEEEAVDAPTHGAAFYKEKEKGWFWYEKPPVKPKKKIAKKPPPKKETPKPVEKKPEIVKAPPAAPAAPAGPTPLSAKWYAKNLEKYKQTAIDNPTPENVRAYLYLQKVMMDKAERFSNVFTEVSLGDPFLDESHRYSTSSMGSRAAEDSATKAREDLLVELSSEVGLFFFFDEDCDVCDQQAWILSMFEKETGISVTGVSVDGSEMETKHLRNVVLDEGYYQGFKLERTPAIVAVRPPDKFLAISQGGGMSLPNVGRSVVLFAKKEGVISPETYDTTRVTGGYGELINIDYEKMQGIDFNDPSKIVKALRKMSKGEKGGD